MKRLNIKKGRILDKYRFRCSYCGRETYKPLWLLKLRLMFTDELLITCKYCHSTSAYVNIFHLRHDSMSKLEKEYNKKKWDKRM